MIARFSHSSSAQRYYPHFNVLNDNQTAHRSRLEALQHEAITLISLITLSVITCWLFLRQ